jgi:hypothetical protein
MKKDDAKSRFGVSVLHAQIPFRVVESLWTYQNRILSLSKESNTMDPKATKAIGIKVIVASAAFFTAEIVFYLIKRGKYLTKDS